MRHEEAIERLALCRTVSGGAVTRQAADDHRRGVSPQGEIRLSEVRMRLDRSAPSAKSVRSLFFLLMPAQPRT
jgi:hypothetical protein